MTDMTAFERQLSDEVSDLMGPIRPVDDGAIFSAISGTRPAMWTIRPMFGATRLAIGAIVVLLGGLLVAGVLNQPSDIGQPASVASPTATGLPSEEIEPGVSRILIDDPGVVAAGADGSVWRVSGEDPSTVMSVVPMEDAAPLEVPFDAWMLEVGPDGVVWVAGPSGIGTLDGRDWTTWSLPVLQQPRAVFPGLDGSALVPWFEGIGDDEQGYADTRIGVDRLTWDGTSVTGEPLEVDVSPWDLAFASTPDGDVWAVVPEFPWRATDEVEGLWRWDGTAWHAEPIPGMGGDAIVRDIAAGPDGTLWVYLANGMLASRAETRRLARLQDGEWTMWTEEDDLPKLSFRPTQRMSVGHDGTLWAPAVGESGDALAAFDGSTWSTHLAGWVISGTTAAPDGSIWATGFQMDGSDYGVFRVTPVEDDGADPGAEPSPGGSPDTGA